MLSLDKNLLQHTSKHGREKAKNSQGNQIR